MSICVILKEGIVFREKVDFVFRERTAVSQKLGLKTFYFDTGRDIELYLSKKGNNIGI